MAEPTLMRAALLARPGEACDRLGTALREAGVEVVLVGDPRSLDPEALRSCAPEAVLVALEPEVEDSIDRFDLVLHDPGVLVIFDEAQLASQRVGWDAARWSRHLSAKLHRHHDVLPPGADNDAQWQPSPGALARPMADDALDFADFASEAQSLGRSVPRDDVPETPTASEDGRLELEWTAGDELAEARPSSIDEPVDHMAEAPPIASAVDAELHAETDAALDQDGDFDSISLAGFQNELDGDLSTGDLSLDPDVLAMLQSEPPADDHSGFSAEPPPRAVPAWDAARSDAPALVVEDADDGQPIDPSTPKAADDITQAAIDRSAALSLADTGELLAQPTETPHFDPLAGSGLSLVDDDAPDVKNSTSASTTPDTATDRSSTQNAVDLDALDQRAAALSLAPTDTYGYGPLRGAVVVEAGLGGPDAVRQLLAGLSEGFPRPLLVRLQLDGGRYDRLVKQMARASALPVALAESGMAADPGTAYFMPAELAVARKGAGLVFVDADDAATTDWLDALPAGDSALLLLSGSDAARVPQAVALSASGALVAAQSPEECYDHAAAGALIASGGAQGTPAQLAERLVERWS